MYLTWSKIAEIPAVGMRTMNDIDEEDNWNFLRLEEMVNQ